MNDIGMRIPTPTNTWYNCQTGPCAVSAALFCNKFDTARWYTSSMLVMRRSWDLALRETGSHKITFKRTLDHSSITPSHPPVMFLKSISTPTWWIRPPCFQEPNTWKFISLLLIVSKTKTNYSEETYIALWFYPLVTHNIHAFRIREDNVLRPKFMRYHS